MSVLEMDLETPDEHLHHYIHNWRYTSAMRKYIDMLHGSINDQPLGPVVTAPFSCQVLKVQVRDNVKLLIGQPILKVLVPSSLVPFQTSSELDKSTYKDAVEGRSRVGVYPIEDVLVNLNATSPMPTLDNEVVLKNYENFKKFDVVVDHSDHLFSAYRCSEMQQPDWVNTIKEQWRILEQHLPDTIYVRVYESRMDLLRAVIIGPQGTPYQDGLFIFDLFFPENYPNCPPLVRYHSGGLAINPSMNKCGEVCLNLFTPSGRLERLWGFRRNALQLLVCIQDLILNSKPYFNGFINASLRGSVAGEWLSFLYNENTIIKSLKTVVYTINKPPKNFEDLVIGHFRKRVRDILTACKAYMEGLQLGCLVSDNNVTCSIRFKNDVASSIKPLVDAFKKIGAKEAQEFLHLIKKRKVVSDEDMNHVVDRKRKDADICHDVPWNLFSYRACAVGKVLVKDGMWVDKGQPLYICDVMKLKEVIVPISSSAIVLQSAFKRILYENRRSGVGIFSMEDVLLGQDDAGNSPMAGLDIEDVLNRYENVKKFESVMDHSDHFFSAQSSTMNQPPKDCANKIHEEWRILEEHLPENIFVRVYESRIDLLRAVIIGPEGTPYHGGLFFFDVCFPSDYPNSPPLVHYHSSGLGINPNLYKCGKVRLSLAKTDGSHESMWVPSTSTMLQLLVSIQNQILNTKPLFNDLTYANMRGSIFGEHSSLLYNENSVIKSLKTMVYIMNKPPKNFEDFVVGYFHNGACDILREAFAKKNWSVMYRDDLLSCLKPLLAAFKKIGVKEKRLSKWRKK